MRMIAPLMALGLATLMMIPTAPCRAGSRLPVWSPLTAFEAETLESLQAAQSGKPDTLLALALIASGDVRDSKNYRLIKSQIERFVEKSGPSIRTLPSVYEKGERLLNAMHARFFTGGKNQNSTELIKGYHSEQSRVSEIFRSGRFNCISSAILYIILARYLDLDVEGVVTTQHAFIQIRDSGGRFIEVETTSNQGYGLVHDEAFYKNSFARFSLSRNLSVPTYEDYLKRRVVPPYQLIAQNMNHQHTARSRMDDTTRWRLYELMGYLDSESASSQLIRLNTLTNACVQYLGQQDRSNGARLFTVLDSVLQHVKSRPWIKETSRKDIAEIWDRISTIHLMLGHLEVDAERFDGAHGHYSKAREWARTQSLETQAEIGQYKAKGFGAFRQKRWHAAIQSYQKLLPLIEKTDTGQRDATCENIAAAFWNLANAAGHRDDWTKAAEHYVSAAKWTRNSSTLKKAKSAGARAKAMHHYESRDWNKAIEGFKAALPLQDKEHGLMVRNNIGMAYISWGNTLFSQQAYDTALDKYEAALDMLPLDKRELVYKNIAAAYHNMTVPMLRKKQFDKAADIMTSGVKRFPHCEPCRQRLNQTHQQVKKFKTNKK